MPELRLRKKFDSIKQYWEFVYDNFLKWENVKLLHNNWTEEEYKKLTPFFKFDERNRGLEFKDKFTPEEDASFMYYKSLVESIEHQFRIFSTSVGSETVVEIFQFEDPYEEDWNSEEEFLVYPDLERNSPLKFKFDEQVLDKPFVINLWWQEDFDRCGKSKINFFDCYVLDDFEDILECCKH